MEGIGVAHVQLTLCPGGCSNFLELRWTTGGT